MASQTDIRNSNPWWKDPLNIHSDSKIREWEDSPICYKPRLMFKIAYDFDSSNTVVYSLRGPRQIGKTTLVKLQIKQFLEADIHPLNIFYYPMDLVSTARELVDIVDVYLQISARHRKGARAYIFLDEISAVSQWQRGIKWLVDTGKLQNCTIVATGSNAIDIRNSTEKLPGRRGVISDTYDKILLPMKFSEYAPLLNNEIDDLIHQNDLLTSSQRKIIFAKLLDREIDESLELFHQYQGELDELLHNYMLTGGIPQIINEQINTTAIREDLYTSYLDGIAGEWTALSKNEMLLKQFCGAIIKGQGSNISWSGLAKEAALGSKNTAINYASTLADLFVVSIIHLYGMDKKRPRITSNNKLYFQDPYYLHIFNGLMEMRNSFDASLDYIEDSENQGKIVEGIMADHLIRWAFTLSNKKQTFDYHQHLFYWKDEKNREVDFVLFDGGNVEVPIEVKYRNKMRATELAPMIGFLNNSKIKNGLVISKSDLRIASNYTVIPASLFLLLI